jgi:hypothetical protein
MSNTEKIGNLYSVILCTWSISIVRRCETKAFVLLVIIYLAWTQFEGFFRKQLRIDGGDRDLSATLEEEVLRQADKQIYTVGCIVRLINSLRGGSFAAG